MSSWGTDSFSRTRLHAVRRLLGLDALALFSCRTSNNLNWHSPHVGHGRLKTNQNALQQKQYDTMIQITKFAALRPCIGKPHNNVTLKKPPPRASQNIRLRRNPMHCRHITAVQFHLSDRPSRVKGPIKYKHSHYRDLSVRQARRQGYAAGVSYKCDCLYHVSLAYLQAIRIFMTFWEAF